MKSTASFFLISFIIFPIYLHGQDDLFDMFEKEETNFAYASFKSTRIVLGQSIENPKNGSLNMEIQHQFGNMNGGGYELWGLDQATMRFGFDYGITNWLAVGVGRSSLNKTYDGHVKTKILRQSSGARKMPIALSYFGGVYYNSLKWEDPDRENYEVSRLSYAHQLLIARKFTKNITFQITPSFIHRNLVETAEDENDVFSVGAGGRFKLTKWISINAEYFYLLPGNTADKFEDSFSVGVDIETGGHVFQVYLTNSQGMQEPYFIANTSDSWSNGDLHLAFNLIRTFSLKKPDSFKKDKKEKKNKKEDKKE